MNCCKTLSVLIADDQALFRNTLAIAINEIPIVKKVFQAGNGVEVMKILDQEAVDVLLLDLKMPVMDGYETCRLINEQKRIVKIILLSMFLSGPNEGLIKTLGADACLSKDVDFTDLEETINEVTKDLILERSEKKVVGLPFNLSEREYEVLKLINKGLTSKEIADVLFISKRAVDSRRDCLYRKIGAKNSSEAIFIANRVFLS